MFLGCGRVWLLLPVDWEFTLSCVGGANCSVMNTLLESAEVRASVTRFAFSPSDSHMLFLPFLSFFLFCLSSIQLV